MSAVDRVRIASWTDRRTTRRLLAGIAAPPHPRHLQRPAAPETSRGLRATSCVGPGYAARSSIVLNALGPDQVTVVSAKGNDPADFEYICRAGHILVRDNDLDRVLRELPNRPPTA